MKKTILAAVLLSTSFAAISAPYIGLEYGFGSTSHDAQSDFKDPSIKLDPSLEDGIFGGFVGYSLTPSWAVELGYNHFELSDGQSQQVSMTAEYEEEREWDAKVKATQFSLAPVYTYAMNDRWSAKIKAGFTYTQYDVSGSQTLEKEFHVTDVETSKHEDGYSSSSNEIGGLVSLGTEYRVLPQLTVGANVKYQFDSFANTASFNLGSTYYF